ncbi:MAG: hypothetical protein Kow0025_02380 [Thermodesulfovibrionales bacterium]
MRWLRALVFVILASALLVPSLARASATERARVAGSFLVGGYQVRVFALPEHITAGKEATLTLKIHNLGDVPARGGRVLVSITEGLAGAMEGTRTPRYREAAEADGLGDYEIKAVFGRAGDYFVRVRIEAIEGRTFDEPLAAGFTLNVTGSPSVALRLGLVMGAAALMTAAGLYLLALRRKAAPGGGGAFNLLDIPWVKGALRLRHIQPVFQVPLLVLFSMLVLLAFFDVQDGGRNLSTKVIWTIWWAGIIFTFVLVGRVWCFMCPVGAVSEWTSRLARPRRRFPRALRNLWIANAVFILLTWLDAQLGVVRSPWVTGTLVLAIVAASVLTAVFYERRTFCRYLCPIGGLIGLYSMFSPVELRCRDSEVCRNHERKDCYLGNENGRGCPMFEMVPAMDGNNHCNFCGECVKSCPRDNIAIRLRPFFQDAWRKVNQSFDQAVMAVVLVGVSIFVTGDMLEPWDAWMKSAMALVPADLLGIKYEYTVEVITKSALYFAISLVAIPGMVLAAAYASGRLAGAGNRRRLRDTFTAFGYMFIPVGLSMHLSHNLGHLLNESAAAWPAFQRALNLYTPFSLGEPDWQMASMTLLGPGALYAWQMALLLVFHGFALYSGYRLSLNLYGDSRVALRAFAPMALAAFALMAVNIFLLNMPMAPRHIH